MSCSKCQRPADPRTKRGLCTRHTLDAIEADLDQLDRDVAAESAALDAFSDRLAEVGARIRAL